MIKRCGFITRRGDLSHDAFVAYRTSRHAALGEAMPGLRRYVVNFIDRRRFPDCAYDGFSELWFDSEADLQAALASSAGQAMLADVPNFIDVLTATVIEERVIVAG